jgi:hypothetical protein
MLKSAQLSRIDLNLLVLFDVVLAERPSHGQPASLT